MPPLPALGSPSGTCPCSLCLDPAEPHEICDEDNFGTVIWKETPAGEVAAVRCPRNATGEARRPLVWGALSCPLRAACGAVRGPGRPALGACRSGQCTPP